MSKQRNTTVQPSSQAISKATTLGGEYFELQYSSLTLDQLKNYHIKSGAKKLLQRAPSNYNFVIKEEDLCEKFVLKMSLNFSKVLPTQEQERPEEVSGGSSMRGVAGAGRLLAVAVVGSALRNWRERQNVRQTWGHPDIVLRSGVSALPPIQCSNIS